MQSQGVHLLGELPKELFDKNRRGRNRELRRFRGSLAKYFTREAGQGAKHEMPSRIDRRSSYWLMAEQKETIRIPEKMIRESDERVRVRGKDFYRAAENVEPEASSGESSVSTAPPG